MSFAQPLDLKSRVDALSVDLKAAAAPNDDLKKSLIALRAAIGVLEAKAPDDIAAFISQADDLILIAARIVSNKTTITPALSDKASGLVMASQPLEVNDPTKVAANRADALTGVLNQSGIILTYGPLQASIAKLLVALDPVEGIDFLTAVKRRSDSLTKLLNGAAAAGPPISVDAIQAVTNLDTVILTYRQHGDPRVDILFAEYGDLDLRGARSSRHRRVCDATAAMRKACQDKTTCSLPDNTPQSSLCGYDPVPDASSRDKGAWILFRCVDSLLNVYLAPSLPSMVADRGNASWVPLRSSSEQFGCMPPGPTAEAKK